MEIDCGRGTSPVLRRHWTPRHPAGPRAFASTGSAVTPTASRVLRLSNGPSRRMNSDVTVPSVVVNTTNRRQRGVAPSHFLAPRTRLQSSRRCRTFCRRRRRGSPRATPRASRPAPRVARARLRVRPSPRTDPESRLAEASGSPARRRARARRVREDRRRGGDVLVRRRRERLGDRSEDREDRRGGDGDAFRQRRRFGDAVEASAVPNDRPERGDADAAVAEVLATIADTDSGRNVTPEQRRATDANIALLEAVGATQTPNALNNPLIFGDYDVSYVSTGGRQIGNPAAAASAADWAPRCSAPSGWNRTCTSRTSW